MQGKHKRADNARRQPALQDDTLRPQTRGRETRFVLLFALSAIVGFALMLVPPIVPRIQDLSRAITVLSGAIIKLAGGRVLVAGNVLTAASGFSVRILNGCNGINVVILLWSAVIAWPASAVEKFKGMLLGALVIQVANLIRVITLFYLGQWNAAWFEWMHLYVGEILIMLLGLTIFAVWVRGTLERANFDRAR